MSTMPYVPRREDPYCSGCGYGIVVRGRLPERCPMCGGSGWALRRPVPRVPDVPAAPRRFVGASL